MLKVVLDTNQLVSSLLSTRGPQGQLIDAWRRRAFALFIAPGQLEDVAEVLRRPKISRKYSIAPADQRALLELLRSEAILLPDTRPPGICRDPEDDYLLGCAAAGGADHLVTGDADLLSVGEYGGMVIVAARQFLGLLSV